MAALPAELWVLVLGCVLGLVHIFTAIGAKTAQYGRDWNMGARDETMPALNPVAGRLERARANYLETFPIMAALLLAVVVAERAGPISSAGGWIWLAARIVYLPLYWRGVPKIRTYAYAVSLTGMALVFAALVRPA